MDLKELEKEIGLKRIGNSLFIEQRFNMNVRTEAYNIPEYTKAEIIRALRAMRQNALLWFDDMLFFAQEPE